MTDDAIDPKIFMPGAYQDTVGLIELITRAASVSDRKWSLRTFCHRTTGDGEILMKLRMGRLPARRYPAIKRDMENFIAQRT